MKCPACSGELSPKVLGCGNCGVEVRGTFELNEFAMLSGDDLQLLRIFVLAEGRIRDMEAPLGLSYPTIRTRLATLRAKLAPGAESQSLVAPAIESAGADTRPQPKRGFIERTIEAVSGGQTSKVTGVLASGLRDNDFSMSHVDVRQSKGAVFASNSIRMSRLGNVELTESELSENELHSVSMQNVDARHSELKCATLFASTIDTVKLDHTTAREMIMRSSVWKHVEMQRAQLSAVVMHSAVLKHCVFGPDVTMVRTMFESLEARDLNAKDSNLTEVTLTANRISGLTLTNATLRIATVRGYRWKDVRLADCVFDDVLFRGEGNRKSAFTNVTFENCNISRSIFSDTALTDVVIRNVTIDNVKAMGVVVKDRVIDGNEEFLEAVGIKPVATSSRVF